MLNVNLIEVGVLPNGNASEDCNIFVAALFSPATSVLLFSFGFCSEVEGSVCSV